MDAEKKQRTGILLICLLILGYITFYDPFGGQEESNNTDKQADQEAEKTFLDKQRALALKQAPVQSGLILENADIRCEFSPKGARMRQVTQKKFTRHGQKTPISSWDHKYSYDNLAQLTPKSKDSQSVTISDLDFTLLSHTANAIIFSYQNPKNAAESLQISYELVEKNGVSIIERQIKAGDGWDANSTVNHHIYRAVPQQEIHRNSSLRKVYLNHEENGSWNYQSKPLPKGKNIGKAKWVSFTAPFFLTGFIFPQAGKTHIGIAEIKPPVKGADNSKRPDLPSNTLKEMGITVSIPTAQLQKGYKTGYYFGPNTPEALAAVDQYYKKSKLNFKDNYYYGPRGFASVNKYILHPIFNYFVQKTGNPVSALFLLLLLIALFSFFFVYKSQIATIKRKTVKPFIDAMKAKGGDNIRMQESQFYKKVGMNPLSMLFIGFFNVFLFIGMFNLLNYSKHFRHEKLWWIEDLSSFDATWQLPVSIPLWGQHISALGLFTFSLTLLFSYWDKYKEKLKNSLGTQEAQASSHTDTPDNPLQIPKPLQYVLKVMPLVILNNRTAAITLFRLFSVMIERIQKLICSIFINETQLKEDVNQKAAAVASELQQANTSSRVMSRLEQRLAKKKR